MAVDKIEVQQGGGSGGGSLYLVVVGSGASATRHAVTVSSPFLKKLNVEREDVADLVKRSFEFLLAREPKESILSKFDLSVISKYFPEYEEEITL